MTSTSFGEGRRALEFAQSKINLYQAGHEFEPKAERPTPGWADLCLVVGSAPDGGDLDGAIAALLAAGVPIGEGPVERTGALGTMQSVYVREPDRNSIELSEYLEPGQHVEPADYLERRRGTARGSSWTHGH